MPNNLITSAAANVNHEQVVELVDRHYARVKPRQDDHVDPTPVPHSRITLRNKKTLEQVDLCLGVPSYPLPHERRYACYLLNTLLGGGMNFRLFQKIRECQGLACAVSSEVNPYSGPRLPFGLCRHFQRIGPPGGGRDPDPARISRPER